MIPIGAITRGVKGFFDVKKMDESLAAIAHQVSSLQPVQGGLLEGLAPRQRAEAELKLLLIEADWRRRMGQAITHFEERIGALVQEVRELQLKETPASKWDIEVMTQAMTQLADDFRQEVAAIDQRAQDQAKRLTQLTEQLSKESTKATQVAGRLDKQHTSLKTTLAKTTTVLTATTVVSLVVSVAGLVFVLLQGH